MSIQNPPAFIHAPPAKLHEPLALFHDAPGLPLWVAIPAVCNQSGTNPVVKPGANSLPFIPP